MQDLLREAQIVYMRRDKEKHRIQAKVLVAAVREEAQKQEQVRESAKPAQSQLPLRKQNPSQGKYRNNQKKNIECVALIF